jgi:hypothetical protein
MQSRCRVLKIAHSKMSEFVENSYKMFSVLFVKNFQVFVDYLPKAFPQSEIRLKARYVRVKALKSFRSRGCWGRRRGSSNCDVISFNFAFRKCWAGLRIGDCA